MSYQSVETPDASDFAGLAGPGGRLRVTPGRVAVLTLGVPIVLALIGWLGFTAVALLDIQSFPVNETIPVVGGKVTAQIEGSLTVRQDNVSAAQLTGTATYSLFRPALTVRPADQNPAGTGALVAYRCDFGVGDCSLDGTLTLPATAAAVLHTGGGDVTMANYTGDLTLDTDGGNVNVGGTLTGTDVQMSTAGGDVTMGNYSGDLTLDTGGGNVNVGGTLTGTDVQMSTVGGDVTVNTLDGPVNLTTGGGNINIGAVTPPESGTEVVGSAGGDVTIVFTKPPSNLQIDSGGGNVRLILPAAGQYAYNVTTDGGNQNIPRQAASPKDFITVNSGGGDVTVSYS